MEGDILEKYFETELGSLYKGDCLEVMDYLIENNVVVDAVITDPPYAITNYSWDQIIPFPAMWERLEKLIKYDGAIVLFGNEPFSSNVRISNEKLYKYDWKWLKTQITGYQNAKHQPLRCYEDIMVFSKSGITPNACKKMIYYPQGTIKVDIPVITKSVDYLKSNKVKKKKAIIQEYSNYPRNVIQFARETKLYHPTQKPVTLLEYLVATYTREYDLVLDFTAGSGTTLLACEGLKRRWIGIELAEDYCSVIKKRIENGIQMQLNFQKSENEEE